MLQISNVTIQSHFLVNEKNAVLKRYSVALTMHYVQKNLKHASCNMCTEWQWRNFFIPYLCQLFSRHDVR